MSQGWQKHLHVSFGQAKYTAGIMHLHLCKAADYLCKALMVVSPLPQQRKCWYLGSLRVHLLAIHISVSQGTS